uniref:Cytosolic endo-beta-N-acetylglucosaminidase n=1 Tax=Neogobius melanostomus TaxID=47308 RepID=A0A8C6U244_9GOBI
MFSSKGKDQIGTRQLELNLQVGLGTANVSLPIPIICGLNSLDDLLSWKRSEAHLFNVSTVPLSPRDPPLSRTALRTLVSHDMMGGYLDDRFLQGSDSDQPYSFYHWQHIDIFNYFTHNMVTIPPAGWTNAAHRHGVLVLGTFITEWTEGGKACEAFLKDEESYRTVADKLVQICHCYGFDGWLINIENELSATAVKKMPLFLRYLTEQTHERVSGGLVLWYDSVLETGRLVWQNELNEHNRLFFDVCDGFFTNYNWTEQNLEWMASYSGVQGRQADVYIGVDVFARGEVVGGMYDTNKALEMIRKHNFSAAIFAPGWVYETQERTQFRHNQDKFWSLLSDHLPIHRPVSSLPFTSTFCQGFGKALYWRGSLKYMSLCPSPSAHGCLCRPAAPDRIEGLCIYDVVWLRGADAATDSHPRGLLLNATLRWVFKPELVTHYRVHWRRLRGPDPRVPAEPLQLVSRAYAQLFRLTELPVPGPPALLELVVEPVLRSGFTLPQSQWGRAKLSYSQEQRQED